MSQSIKKTSPTPEKLFTDALAQEDFFLSHEDMRLLVAGLSSLRGKTTSHKRIKSNDLRTCRPLSTDTMTHCPVQTDNKPVIN